MPVEDTDLERRVLAHEQILQALLAQMAQADPNVLDQMRHRFASVRRGAYEHDYVETADYAEAFLREVSRLVRAHDAKRTPAAEPLLQAAERIAAAPSDTVLIHSARSGGVWHVTQDGAFVGDYLAEAPARQAAADAARQVEGKGGRASVLFGPNT